MQRLPTNLKLRKRKGENLITDDKLGDELESCGGMFADANDTTNTLEGLLHDLKNSRQSKRKKVELLKSDDVISNIIKKMSDLQLAQSNERKTLQDRFSSETSTILTKFQLELENMKSDNDKLQKAIIRQQKTVQQNILVHSENIGALQQLMEVYIQGCQMLETNFENQINFTKADIAKDIAAIVEDMRKQETAKLRQSLAAFL